MFDKYKIVCVTPAGRRQYLKLLVPYIMASPIVDEFHLWRNTSNKLDNEYIDDLGRTLDRVHIIEPAIQTPESNYIASIYQFFRHCIDEETIYIRFDDDIVFVEPDFFPKFLRFRIANPNYFLVFPNIINNAICTYIQATRGAIDPGARLHAWCMDEVAWGNSHFAEQLHRAFLRSISDNDLERWYFAPTPLAFCRFSINCMAWFGRDFRAFEGNVPDYEEEYLSVHKPAELMRDNCIYGEALVSHFSYYVQRRYLDSTNLLACYAGVANGGPSHQASGGLPVPIGDLWTPRLLRVLQAIQVATQEQLKDADYLTSLIRNAGLQFDPRSPYGRDNCHMNSGERRAGLLVIDSGLWQMPGQLAKCLVYLSRYSIASMIEIGTGSGWTTSFIAAYLARFNSHFRVVTIDAGDYFRSYYAVKKVLPIEFYVGMTSDSFVGESYDLAFIDGDHTYRGCSSDYEAVGRHAKICMFHDINDKFVRNHPANDGGVPRLWQEIKHSKPRSDEICEFLDHSEDDQIMGIGLIVRPEAVGYEI
jgi:hypothetical protein